MTAMSNFLSAAIPVLPVFLAVGGFWFVIFKLRKKLNGALAQRDSKGRRVDETRAARSMVGNLPGDVGFVASLGRDAAPLQSLDRLILRPTWGLRLVSLGFSALLLGMAFLSRGEILPDSPYAIGALFGAQALGIAVPAALSITGYDNLPIASQVPPGLTTVDVPARQMGLMFGR